MTQQPTPLGRRPSVAPAILFVILALLALPGAAQAQWAAPTPGSTDIVNTNSGNVGIGTSDARAKLSLDGDLYVRGSTNSSPRRVGDTFADNSSVQLRAGSTAGVFGYVTVAGDWNGSSFGGGKVVLGTAGVDRLTVDRSGNVGVGTFSPADLFHVYRAGAHVGSIVEAGTTGYAAFYEAKGAYGQRVRLQAQGAAGNPPFVGSLSNDDFLVVTNGAEKLRVTAGGSVGIGTGGPRGRFEVAGGSVFFGDMGQAGWGNVIVRGRVFSSSGNIHLSPPGGATVYINSDYREAGGATGPVNLDVSGAITGGNIQAKFQDVAEWVPSAQKLSAGMVVVIDPERANQVVSSTQAYDTRVAGVVSARPGIALGEGGEGKVLVATTGRVKVRVDATRAPVRIGDLLVTSEAPGVAMRSEPVVLGGRKMHAPGTIIGKALEPLGKGTGEILVLLSLQ